MGKKLVTPELAEEIARMREEVDGWGDRKWSCAAIAEKLGLSESTIWRVDSRKAAYAGKNPAGERKREAARWEALAKGELEVGAVAMLDAAAIAASLAKVQAGLGRAASKEVLDSVKEQAKAYIGGRDD